MHFSNFLGLFAFNFCLFFIVKIEGVNSDTVPAKPDLDFSSKDDEACLCTNISDPVCGSDGKTYGNPCELGCKRKENPFVFGVCKGECPCCKEPFHNNPLAGHEETGFWGWDRNTGDSHQIILAQVEEGSKNIEEPSYCKEEYPVPNCIITMIYAPVCGSDGNTYVNKGALACQQQVKPCLKKACDGPCPCCACTSSDSGNMSV